MFANDVEVNAVGRARLHVEFENIEVCKAKLSRMRSAGPMGLTEAFVEQVGNLLVKIAELRWSHLDVDEM